MLVLFTLLFAVGSGISILTAPMAAAVSPFMNPLNPPEPMMSDDICDRDRARHRELPPLLF